jgi:nucleoid-associated protein YgaU
MRKDFKTGVFLGMALVTAAAVWLSTRQCLSIKSRMLDTANPTVAEKPATDEIYYPKGLGLTILSAKTPQVDSITVVGEKQKIHIVQPGESLYSISRKYYGSADKWYKILELNRLLIKEPNKLAPGTKLIIPP